MRIPTAVSLALGITGAGIWGFLMVFSIAFVIYDQPLSFSDDKFLLYFMIKHYPLVMLGLFLVAVKFKDENGFIPFSAVALPSLFLVFLIFDMIRVSIIDWDDFETPQQKQFIYESAFGSEKSLERLFPLVKTVNFMGEAGLTPLLAAYKGRNNATFQYLLDKGANVNFMPKGSLQYNVANYIISDFEQDRTSQEYFVKLIKYGLNIHIGTKLSHLLQSAATGKRQWYLEYLLANGADPNRKGTIFLTPIGLATLHKHWENAMYLVHYSNIDGLQEAAAIFYEDNERGMYRNEDLSRDALEQVLLDKNIDFKKAFEVKDAERQKRLANIHAKDNK
jgi:hypothetical protein